VKYLLATVSNLDKFFQIVAGIMLVSMLLITITDVALRLLGKPFFGTIEIICFCGAMLIGFGLPHASWSQNHINVDIVLVKLPPRAQVILRCLTKSAGALFFTFIAYNFVLYGLELLETGEVSGGLRISYAPVMFTLGFSCFLQALTLLCDIPRFIIGERNG